MKENPWARLLAYVTGLINQELLLKNEYLAFENRILQAHCLHRDPEIAWNAIRKLEAYQVRLVAAK